MSKLLILDFITRITERMPVDQRHIGQGISTLRDGCHTFAENDGAHDIQLIQWLRWDKARNVLFK